MNKKILFLILTLAISIMPFFASADELGTSCGDTSGGNEVLEDIAGRVIITGITVGSAMAVIGFIVAGIMYLKAAGSPEKTNLAKQALFAAIIGCAILALAGGAEIMTGIFCAIIEG